MRICIHQFSIANEAYIGASVSFYTVDGNGAKTSTLATLYDGTTGTGTLSNPQTLDSEGKLSQPAYIDEPVIASVSGLGFTDHDTGIINLIVNDKGDWVTATVYAVNDLVNDAADTGNKYICTARHTSGTFATDRDTNGYWSEFIDLATVKDWAYKTGATVDGSEYSAKEYAQGTTVPTGSAKDWAQQAEDSDITGSGEYSALHHAAKALASRTAAEVAQAAAEAAANGIYWKVPADCVAVTNITLSGEQTIDGVTTSTSRVVAAGQTAPEENGVYVSSAGAWVRSAPLDTWDEHVGAALTVTQGTTYADTQWLCTVDPGGTLETTAITWAQRAAGDMKKADNLAGLASPATSRANLGIDGSSGNIALGDLAIAAKTEHITIACSDETTDLESGTAKVTFRMPYALTLTGDKVRASVTEAPTGSELTVDINEGGSTILSTKLTIDATEKTSTTAATPAVVSDSVLADDAEITIDLDGVGSTTPGKGLKVTLIGYKP